jgi:hypothetical protein
MTDENGTRLRERVWIEKWDKESDPPRLVETLFVENGKVISVTPGEDADGVDKPREK